MGQFCARQDRANPRVSIVTAAKIRPQAFSGALVALALIAPPNAGHKCRAASERYESAVAEVIGALQAYMKCVLSSQKRDDCAAQMEELDSAHDEFADAVSEYPGDCP
jgi:hypothetical protein